MPLRFDIGKTMCITLLVLLTPSTIHSFGILVSIVTLDLPPSLRVHTVSNNSTLPTDMNPSCLRPVFPTIVVSRNNLRPGLNHHSVNKLTLLMVDSSRRTLQISKTLRLDNCTATWEVIGNVPSRACLLGNKHMAVPLHWVGRKTDDMSTAMRFSPNSSRSESDNLFSLKLSP